jgi:hypothetical protein
MYDSHNLLGFHLMFKQVVLFSTALLLCRQFAVADDQLPKDTVKQVASSETRLIVYDGQKVGESAKGWANGAGKVAIAAQDKVVREKDRKTVEFHAEGKEFLGCGWNWFGWYPHDGGNDISAYKNLRFWAKLDGDVKPTLLNVSLIANDKEKKTGATCNLFQYCPTLGDGKWHELVVPISDLDPKQTVNQAKVWEVMLGSWSADAVNYTLYVDQIAFTELADHKAISSPMASSPPSDAPHSIAVAAASLPVQVAADNPQIRYVGRWDRSTAAAPRASWTCSTVMLKFKGTAVNAKLKGGGFYEAVVDGQPAGVVAGKNDPQSFEIARDLPNKDHVVEIVRRDEGAWITPITFLGFELAQGSEVLSPPPSSGRRLLIIGDSISCGYGNEATRDEGNPPDKENGYLTYGAIAARKLNAEAQIIAWSGRKLFPDNTMVEVYPRTLAMDAEPKADLKSWIPGVVLIDLGTNDFRDAKKQPDEQGWIAAYKNFIASIRQTAPDSYVFVASGPMGTSANWDKWAKTVVSDLQEKGDKRIAYLPFATQDVNGDGIGGHWHPNLKTHAKMADRLVQEIAKAVGWK